MKKLNKLFAILFAVLGVTTLKAQTDVTSQYLTNAGFDDNSSWITSNVSQKTTKAAKGWTATSSGDTWYYGGAVNYGSSRTINSVTPPAKNPEGNADGGALGISAGWGCTVTYKQEVTLPAGVYTLSYKAYNANTGATQANNYIGFTSSSVTVYGKTTNFTANTWVEESVTFALSSQTTGNISVGMGAISGGSGANAKLFVDGVKLSYKSFDEVSAENPADLTSHIVNNSFETGNLNGWTYKGSSDTGVKANSNNTYKTSGVDGNYLYNTWWQGTPLTQTVGNIPNGIYELKVLLASDQNAKLFLLANGEHSEVYTITTDNKTFHDVSYEFKVLNGQATIGVIGGNDAGEYVDGGHWWYKADNFRLIYKGADISIEKEALEANIATARAIDQATIPTAIATQLTAAITAAENVEQTLNAIKAATNELIEIINLANELKEPYGDAKTLIAECEAMSTNSTASDTDKATYQSAINKAKDDLEDANTKAAIDDIMATLRDAQKAYCLVAAPTEGHPFDLTWLVVNPKFDEGTKGWTSNTSSWSNTIATNQGGAITGNYYENWNESSYTGEIYQQLENLPKGKYVLTAAAFRDQLTGGAAEGDAVYVFANDQATLVTSATPEFYSVEVSTTTGTLKFGVKSVAKVYKWMGIDNVTLKYVAGLDLSEFEAAYNAALEAAIAARDNAEYNNVTGVEKTALLDAISATPEQSQESLNNATEALVAATATFTAAKGDYDKLVEEKVIAKGLGMSDDLINSAVANTKTGIQALQDLKVAEYTYIKATFTEEAPIGTWTENFAEDLNGEGYKPDGEKYLNEWGNATRTSKQTVTLPKGDYALSSIGRGQVGTSGYLYYKIGDKTTQVDFIMKGNRGRGVDVDGVATFSDEATYNCNGEGFGWEYRFITFHLDTETEVEIGVSATFSNAWVSIYAPKLYTDPSSKKALVLTEIQNLLNNLPSGYMNAEVESTLATKKTIAQSASNANTTAELNAIYAEFKAAVDAANTSIADYKKIAQYIAKANTIDASIAASYKSDYENRTLSKSADDVFKALEVATYNYVTDEFSYPVELEANGWIPEGPTAPMSGQHFDGTNSSSYLEQSADAWGWDAWSISYKHDKTLPAGDYVFKVAGRRASGTGNTMSLVVTNINDPDNVVELGLVNDFPEGDTGLGINTKGKTSFDANDEAGFANNGAGRGWQWRYVKFTLSSETKVRIAVNAEATTNHQWVGFCNATLQMNEETYLTVNMEALDAPTAAAQALANAVPMGADKVEELNAALNRPVTTGQDLWDKIDALNTAVANAKAWVPEYNAAKAPLVAALERFEADYNDAENGASSKMSNSAWANILDKVQAAAVAKDVTDSYEGFADAAENLNSALDAAQASINMYANLAAEISYARAYTPVVTENTDGHTAAIEVAQAAYDAAEIDDASALIFGMQNYRALDYIHITENYTEEVKLGEWTGKTHLGNGEHWSGDKEKTYFDYSKWASGHTNGANEATQTITLPAGKYVLMAAGRAATVAGTEAYIKVNDTKVNFAAKGAYGYGIATDGTANFAADGTYGRDNEGYGWEYRFIEFTLTEETEVTLVAGMTIDVNAAELSWASVCAPVLYTTPLDAAKNDLQKAIDEAKKALNAYPVGEEAFQVSENSGLYVALKNAIETAQNVLDNATTAEDLSQAIEPLNTAVNEYTNGYVLNAPKDGQRFYIKVATEGHGKLDNAILATLGGTSANNPTGYGLNANNTAKGYLAQAFILTQVEGNLYNISIERPEGIVYLTYGSLNGSAAGWNKQQIQATTNTENKGEFKIEATAKEGVLKIFNTVDKNYIDCQNGGSIYTDTGIKNEEFAFELAPEHEVTLKISSVGWATLILPFNAELPEGVVAYESGEVVDDAVQLVRAESLVANTPYLIKGTEGTYNFSGYGLATEDSYTKNLFVGTYVQIKAEVGSYVLQNPKDDEGNPRGLGFYLVGEGKQPTVGAYRSYMISEASAGENKAQMFRIGGTTGIDNATLPNSNEVVIYDLMGRKVTTMEKGNMYIINGRKVIVK